MNENTKEYEKEYEKYNEVRYKKDMNFIKYLELPKNINILEIGAYPYQFTKLLRQEFNNVYTVDKNIETESNFDKQCDLDNNIIPFLNTKFDFVIFNEVFEHLRNPLNAIYGIKRVLKENGILILSTPNLYNISTYLKFLLFQGQAKLTNIFNKELQVGYLGHIREYSKKEISVFMKEAGFKLLNHQYRIVHKQKFIFQLIKWIIPSFRDNQLFVFELSNNENKV